MNLILNKTGIEKIKKFLSINNNLSKTNNILLFTINKELNLFTEISHSYINLKIFKKKELQVIKEGKTLINSKTLLDIFEAIKESPTLTIHKIKEKLIHFNSKYYECDLPIINNDNTLNYEKIPENFDQNSFKISYSILKDSYEYLKEFVKTFEQTIIINKSLSNIFFKKKSNSKNIEVWCSDSLRTVYGEFEINTNETFELNIFPSTLYSIINFFSDYSDSLINFSIDKEKNLFCFIDNWIIKTKIKKCNYPNFMQIFNNPINVFFTIEKIQLLSALERNISFSDKDLGITLYRVTNNNLYMENKEGAKGKSKEVLDIKNSKCQKTFEFYLNNQLLKGLIKTIESKEITFNICDSTKPVIITSNSDTRFKQFILPSRYI